MARSIYCSTCKKEKEQGRENESRCKTCKSEAYKKRRLSKRLEKGLRPFGSGRSLNCCACKEIKENPKAGYCNACKRKHDNEWRISTRRTKKHQNGLCPKCNDEKPNPKWSYCLKCNNLQSAEWKRKNPILTDDELIKKKARLITRYCVRKGYLKEMPCEVCGINEHVEAHHDDYSKPMDIRWLCRKHHREHHKLEKERST
jgi:hypothetical protein